MAPGLVEVATDRIVTIVVGGTEAVRTRISPPGTVGEAVVSPLAFSPVSDELSTLTFPVQ